MEITTLFKKSIILICMMIILIGCKNSPKDILLNGNTWQVSSTTKIKNVNKSSNITFKENAITSSNDNLSIKLEWIDKFSYKQDFNGTIGTVKMRKLTQDQIEFVVLFSSEKNQLSDADWEKYESNNQALYFTMVTQIDEKKFKTYKIGELEIPAEKVPKSGLYILKSFGDAINVIIEDGKVRFQAGKDENHLKDAKIVDAKYVDNILHFTIEEYSEFKYVDEGILLTNGFNWLGNSSEGDVQFVKLEVGKSKDEFDNLLSDAIGAFQNKIAKVKYSDVKQFVDRQYAEYSSKFDYLKFEIDDNYILKTSKYTYPFDLFIVFFKIYPNNAPQNYLEGNSMTSIGGIVFKKIYGNWILSHSNFRLIPIRPNSCYRVIKEQNEAKNLSDGTISFIYFERYYFAMGSSNHKDITYTINPDLEGNELAKTYQ